MDTSHICTWAAVTLKWLDSMLCVSDARVGDVGIGPMPLSLASFNDSSSLGDELSGSADECGRPPGSAVGDREMPLGVASVIESRLWPMSAWAVRVREACHSEASPMAMG